MTELAAKVIARDRRAIARALTVAESGGDAARELSDSLWHQTGQARRIGITGPPGAGKSTLVAALLRALPAEARPVAVVAVDPTSVVSGGALLGDRIRMTDMTLQDDVFIRSFAHRLHPGGLSPTSAAAADIFDAAGFKTIFIETVGVGQAELGIMEEADTVCVVLAPGAGDGIQAMKGGVLEIAEVLCVNKSDLPGADRVMADLEGARDLSSAMKGRRTHIVAASAANDDVADVIAALELGASSEAIDARRRVAMECRLNQSVRRFLHERIDRAVGASPALVDDLLARRITLNSAVQRIELEIGDD